MTRGLALRVDVDFPVGLRRAVPKFLDDLAELEMRATFFVVTGRSRTRRALKRLGERGYLRRLSRLGIGAILRRLGPTLGRSEGFLESAEARRVLVRIVAEGHGLAVHGHDHAWWADHVWSAPDDELEAEIARAFAALQAVTGPRVSAWGSPNWRSTAAVLRALARRAVPYFSECFGSRPFVTLDERGCEIPIPHLPITLPSLESLMLADGLDARAALAALFARRRPEQVDVLCVHDYYEGLLRPGLFRALLSACRERGEPTDTLEHAAASLAPALDALPRSRLTRGPLAGFVGEVSWQASPVRIPVGARES